MIQLMKPYYTVIMIPLILALTGAKASWATTDNAAADLCMKEMLGGQEAVSARITRVIRHDQVPFAYGDADFVDANRVHFRCRIYNDRVTSVKYLVVDPEFLTGTGWAVERPAGADHIETDLNEASMAPPPTDTTDAHFERVPAPSE
jgi:hypothetical protein